MIRSLISKIISFFKNKRVDLNPGTINIKNKETINKSTINSKKKFVFQFSRTRLVKTMAIICITLIAKAIFQHVFNISLLDSNVSDVIICASAIFGGFIKCILTDN